MEWLREHMRNHLVASGAKVGSDAVALRVPETEIWAVGARALQMVERAIQLISDREDDAVARHSSAENLARSAIEELKVAEVRVRVAEMARRAAAVHVAEVNAKLQEMGTALERSQCVVAAAQARTETAERRAKTAEFRLMEAESSLERIETTIRTQIVERGPAGPRSTSPDVHELEFNRRLRASGPGPRPVDPLTQAFVPSSPWFTKTPVRAK